MDLPLLNVPYVHLIRKINTNDYYIFIIVPVHKNATCTFPSPPTLSGGEYLISITGTDSQETDFDYSNVKGYPLNNSNEGVRVKVLTSILPNNERYSNLELRDASVLSVDEWNAVMTSSSLIAYNMPYLYLHHKRTIGAIKKMEARVLIPLLNSIVVVGTDNVSEDTTAEAYTGSLEIEVQNNTPLQWYVPPVADGYPFNASAIWHQDKAIFEEALMENNGGVTKMKGKVKGKSKNHVDNPYQSESKYLEKLESNASQLPKSKEHMLVVKKTTNKIQVMLELPTNLKIHKLEKGVLKAIRALGILAIKVLDEAKSNPSKGDK